VHNGDAMGQLHSDNVPDAPYVLGRNHVAHLPSRLEPTLATRHSWLRFFNSKTSR